MSTPPPPVPSAPIPLGQRMLYMLAFALVFWVLCWVLAIATVLQAILTLLAGRPQPDLVRFGSSLGQYARQIVEFLLFASDALPFPFGGWPS